MSRPIGEPLSPLSPLSPSWCPLSPVDEGASSGGSSVSSVQESDESRLSSRLAMPDHGLAAILSILQSRSIMPMQPVPPQAPAYSSIEDDREAHRKERHSENARKRRKLRRTQLEELADLTGCKIMTSKAIMQSAIDVIRALKEQKAARIINPHQLIGGAIHAPPDSPDEVPHAELETKSGNILSCNRAFCDVFGWAREVLPKKGSLIYCCKTEFIQSLKHAIASKVTTTCVCLFFNPNLGWTKISLGLAQHPTNAERILCVAAKC
jgi:PAS domain-containing protein